jgi:hemolysin activation/secretion protein
MIALTDKAIHSPPLAAKLTLACLAFAFNAQAAALGVPDGASLLQQIGNMPLPPMPAAREVEPAHDNAATSRAAPAVQFMLKRIVITKNTVFDTSTLMALVADAHGKNTSLPELNQLAARITHHYRTHGYPLSRAMIPSQSITLGVITIEVVEARYAKIELANSSRVHDGLLQATLKPLKVAANVKDDALENVLLLLSDIPGIGVKGVFKPGLQDGTADLTVNTTALPMVSAKAATDNYGNAYTGQERLSGSVTVANPLYWGDTLTVNALSSGKGMNYWHLAYEGTVNGLGSRMGISASSLNYALGGAFADILASGSADTQSVWVRHPVVRSPNLDLHLQTQLDGVQTHDRRADTIAQPDRDLSSFTLSLSGNAQGPALGNVASTWKLAWTRGQLRLLDNPEQAGDQVSENPSSFSKWHLNLAHLQRFSAQSALYVTYTGQRAQSRLDPSQKMSVGGPYTVRAYAMGTISGDSVDLITGELQQELGHLWGGQWQAVVFWDKARVTVDHDGTGENNTASLSGAGIGLNWKGPGQWTARTALAIPLGTQSELVSANKSIRAWLEVHKTF